MANNRGQTSSGDFNHDGTVDAADYVVWRNSLGSTYTQDDYNVWRARLGQTAGSSAGTSAIATVPEPATTMLILTTASMLIARQRRAEFWPA